jgi:hypothetical protein
MVRYGVETDEETGQEYMIAAERRIPLNNDPPQRILHRPVAIRPPNAPMPEPIRQPRPEPIRQPRPEPEPIVTEEIPRPTVLPTDSPFIVKISKINYKDAFGLTLSEYNEILAFFRNEVEPPLLDELFGARGKNLRTNIARDYDRFSNAFSKLYKKYIPSRTTSQSEYKVPTKYYKSTDKVFKSQHTFEELTKSIQFKQVDPTCNDIHKFFTFITDINLFFKILVEATGYKLVGKTNSAGDYIIPEKIQRQIEHEYMKTLNDFLSKSNIPGYKNKLNRIKMIIHTVLYEDVYLLERGTPMVIGEGITLLANPIYGKASIPNLGGNVYDIINLFMTFLNMLPSEIQTTYAEYYIQEFIQGYNNKIDNFKLDKAHGWIASCAPGNFQKTLIAFSLLDSFIETPKKSDEEMKKELKSVDKTVLIDNLRFVVNRVYQELYQDASKRMTVESFKESVIENLKKNDNEHLLNLVDEMFETEEVKEMVHQYELDMEGGRKRTRKYRTHYNGAKTKKFKKKLKTYKRRSTKKQSKTSKN